MAGAIEARLHGPPSPGRGHVINALGWAERGLRRLSCLERDAAMLSAFRGELGRGARLIVHVAGPLWVRHLPHGVSGPHGALCAPGDLALPHHTVVVVAAALGCFYLLDPFLSVDGQPLEIPDEEFRAILAGWDAVVVEA